jgi:hypothetical protein
MTLHVAARAMLPLWGKTCLTYDSCSRWRRFARNEVSAPPHYRG